MNELNNVVDASPGAHAAATPPPKLLLRAIEDGFPFEHLSEVAEIESWRKEIYRPIYHLHKWWAQRLGSVFRATILGGSAPKGQDIMKLFYQASAPLGLVVFDPFMGSGTTIGEAHKLGCTAIGRDINPVAVRSVRAALSHMDRNALLLAFASVEQSVGSKLRRLYRAEDSTGSDAEVLYYFWVKTLPCPNCKTSVDLFSSYTFARHAYANRFPTAQVLCPYCGGINPARFDAQSVNCARCSRDFDPRSGPARKSSAVCTTCRHEFPIASVAKSRGEPPSHRMYAKLVLRADGLKEYLGITDADRERYANAVTQLRTSSAKVPRFQIEHGYNTKQAMNYGYNTWDQFFNDRQLLGLSILATAIAELPSSSEREALIVLFSGTLEFNNMFASYKGEGTGAVRHMFAHHILKPERTPIEANLWGTPKSSGSFSTLFQSRLLRALDYREAPFEIVAEQNGGKATGRKVFGLSKPLGTHVLAEYPDNGLPEGAVYISCGTSAQTDLPEKSVDLVITDPPFFDNVHYSELADFFYAWQRIYFRDPALTHATTTRNEKEVQDTNAESFATKLGEVFIECNRVLKDDGLLIFSYHHSRSDGWLSIAKAVLCAGFTFMESQPVKAEMSVATPKSQAKEPIDLDIMLVCRKTGQDSRAFQPIREAYDRALSAGMAKTNRFNRVGRLLSRNDVLVVILGQLLVELSAQRSTTDLVRDINKMLTTTQEAVEQIWASQTVGQRPFVFEIQTQAPLPI